eukprot:SAG31_NODE_6682_length_1922_cov_2.376780_1_plen_530_part_00
MKMSQISSYIDRFWDCLTHPFFPNQRVVDFASYRELHVRIAKTCTPSDEWDLSKSETAAKADWQEDLRAHAPRGGFMGSAFLSHQQFSDAMWMLVDDWSEGVGPAELFIDFLDTVFINITSSVSAASDYYAELHRQLKPIEEVQSMSQKLQNLRRKGIAEGKKQERLAALQRPAESVKSTDTELFEEQIEQTAKEALRTTFLVAGNIIDQAVKSGHLSAAHCNIDKRSMEGEGFERLQSSVGKRVMLDHFVDSLCHQVGIRNTANGYGAEKHDAEGHDAEGHDAEGHDAEGHDAERYFANLGHFSNFATSVVATYSRSTRHREIWSMTNATTALHKMHKRGQLAQRKLLLEHQLLREQGKQSRRHPSRGAEVFDKTGHFSCASPRGLVIHMGRRSCTERRNPSTEQRCNLLTALCGTDEVGLSTPTQPESVRRANRKAYTSPYSQKVLLENQWRTASDARSRSPVIFSEPLRRYGSKPSWCYPYRKPIPWRPVGLPQKMLLRADQYFSHRTREPLRWSEGGGCWTPHPP